MQTLNGVFLLTRAIGSMSSSSRIMIALLSFVVRIERSAALTPINALREDFAAATVIWGSPGNVYVVSLILFQNLIEVSGGSSLGAG